MRATWAYTTIHSPYLRPCHIQFQEGGCCSSGEARLCADCCWKSAKRTLLTTPQPDMVLVNMFVDCAADKLHLRGIIFMKALIAMNHRISLWICVPLRTCTLLKVYSELLQVTLDERNRRTEKVCACPGIQIQLSFDFLREVSSQVTPRIQPKTNQFPYFVRPFARSILLQALFSQHVRGPGYIRTFANWKYRRRIHSHMFHLNLRHSGPALCAGSVWSC